MRLDGDKFCKRGEGIFSGLIGHKVLRMKTWSGGCRLGAAQGAETVASLNSTFERIVQMAIEVDAQVEQIAESANHESAAAITVSDTMRRVAASAKESATGAEQVVAATGELLSTAKSLEGMVQQFNLKELPQDFTA